MSSQVDLRHLSLRLRPGEIIRMTGRDGDEYVRVIRGGPTSAAMHILSPFEVGLLRQESRGRRWYVDLEEVMGRVAA
ncbi:MAG: hypothetical protein ABH877_03110 [bacterium]